MPPEIAKRAQAGNPACEATLRRYEARLGRALAGIINILDPQVIVCLLYTSPSPRDRTRSRMPSSA